MNICSKIQKSTLSPIGNKSDLTNRRQIPIEEAERLAESWRVPYIETSAKTKDNVDRVFYDLLNLIQKQKDLLENEEIKEQKESNSSKKGCLPSCEIV